MIHEACAASAGPTEGEVITTQLAIPMDFVDITYWSPIVAVVAPFLDSFLKAHLLVLHCWNMLLIAWPQIPINGFSTIFQHLAYELLLKHKNHKM